MIGAVIAVIGISIAYRLWVAAPGVPVRLRERFGAVHSFLSHKWYFDELIDWIVVRPSLWFGRLVESVLERIVIGGGLTGGTIGIVRAGSAAVRRWQTGFLRYYAAAMIVCMAGLGLYFLIQAS